jgi:hypothetical protein
VSLIIVPALEEEPWPTLGHQVCAWIEEYLVHGPGDLRGQKARLDAEKRALVFRMYEVYPHGHAQAGRRRFKRACISLRKGSAKTEFAAWIAACELHPDGPVRCDGFDAAGEPVGVGVRDPYIPLVASTEEQSEELAYGALRVILEESPIARDFDIGLERIMRTGGDGKAVALASAPNARDGARTTFQHFDETHRFTLESLRKVHKTMLANVPKRKIADAWSLETTTAFTPGEGSVAEETMEYARAIAAGQNADPRLFFFHRQAGDDHDLTTPEGRWDAVVEASGAVAAWSDMPSILAQWDDPRADRSYLERVWLNRPVRAAQQAFDVERWKELRKDHVIPAGALVTLGFRGLRRSGAAGIVATEIATGHQQVIGVWEIAPAAAKAGAEVPLEEVDARIAEAFVRFDVWKLYAEPAEWNTSVAKWAGQYGEKRIVEWRLRQWRKMADAVRSYAGAIAEGSVSHDGHPIFERHIGNALRREHVTLESEDGSDVWVIGKERPDSPNNVELAQAAVISWQARLDALALGVSPQQGSVYDRIYSANLERGEGEQQELIDTW